MCSMVPSGGGPLDGVKPFGEAIKVVAQGVVDGTGAVLRRVCLPVAKEFGLLVGQEVRHIREVRNFRLARMQEFEARLDERLRLNCVSETATAPPQLVASIVENASWIEDPVVQDMWSGLLASSCTEDGDDDSNLVFIHLLSDLTKCQARLLNFLIEKCEKRISSNGLIHPNSLGMRLTIDELSEISGIQDIQRLDREIDNLRNRGLIHGGLEVGTSLHATVGPTVLALNLYVRAQGSRLSAIDFFKITVQATDKDSTPQFHVL